MSEFSPAATEVLDRMNNEGNAVQYAFEHMIEDFDFDSTRAEASEHDGITEDELTAMPRGYGHINFDQVREKLAPYQGKLPVEFSEKLDQLEAKYKKYISETGADDELGEELLQDLKTALKSVEQYYGSL